MDNADSPAQTKTKKRISANFYTHGKFGRRLREIVDTDNPFLYSCGRYLTKITPDDLPEDYIKIHSRSIWYMSGYLKTSGIVDMYYTYCKENHLFKDDYIYLSYNKKLHLETTQWGYVDVVDYDVCICGNDIVDIVLAAEKYSQERHPATRYLILFHARAGNPGIFRLAAGRNHG